MKDFNMDALVNDLKILLKEHSGMQNLCDATENYVTSGILDSFGIMSYVSEIELMYQIMFDSQELSNELFHTIEGLATLVFEKLKAK